MFAEATVPHSVTHEPSRGSIYTWLGYGALGPAAIFRYESSGIQHTLDGLPAAQAREIAATQRPVTLAAPCSAPAWKTIPSWYVPGTHDEVIAPSLQLRMAERAHSRITRVASGHLSLSTAPGVVTSVIQAAAHTAG